MALLPGSFLLMSSHFIPLPRRSIISASSSADHLDCFFAGGGDRLGAAEIAVAVVSSSGPSMSETSILAVGRSSTQKHLLITKM